jgi:uncharacterized protein YjbJ (UPF0337 family)
MHTVGAPDPTLYPGGPTGERGQREDSEWLERSGTEEAVEGAVEGAKGETRDVVGKVTDRDDLRREGEAQQDKADAQRDTAKKEAEAESARGAAKANEKREAAEQ